jgi:D-beta-D-heptose 7-phosphate kinase/D-beta-D-heptose 1-phosphate adenosyltransferase
VVSAGVPVPEGAADRLGAVGLRDPRGKVFDWAAAAAWRARVAGPVVFTNGVFDLLHPGHIDVLVGARREGAALVVGLNSDESVRRLKGPTRPVRNEAERACVLAALEMVDAVVLFTQDTPADLVARLQPDVIVKGGDYAPDTIVGADVVRARGGRVVVIPLVPGQSTTGIIARLQDGRA